MQQHEKLCIVKPSTHKIWLLIYPCGCYTFPCKLVTRILCQKPWKRIKEKVGILIPNLTIFQRISYFFLIIVKIDNYKNVRVRTERQKWMLDASPLKFLQIENLFQDPSLCHILTDKTLGNLELQMCILICNLNTLSLKQLVITIIKVLWDVGFTSVERLL